MYQEERKLKHIPWFSLIRGLNGVEKGLLGLAFVALVAIAAGLIWVAHHPVTLVEQYTEITDAAPAEVQLERVTESWRTLDYGMTAFSLRSDWVAEPFLPRAWMLWTFACLQILGWGLLLTASTYLRNWTAYLVWFMAVLFVGTSQVSQVLSPGLKWVPETGIVIALLLPLYLFQQGILKAGMLLRFLLLSLVAGAPLLLAGMAGGWTALHTVTIGQGSFLSIAFLLFLFFIGKDLSSFYLLAVTNAKKKSWRLSFPLVLSLYVVTLGLCLLMLGRVMGWHLVPPDTLEIRPVHFLAFVAVVYLVSNLNLWFALRESLNLGPFLLGLAGFGILSLSIPLLFAAEGDHLFMSLTERAWILILTFTTLFHFLYLIFNFYPFLSARSHFYYLSMMPRKLMYFFVVIGSFFAAFTLEALDGVKTRTLLNCNYFQRQGDSWLLQGNVEEASVSYLTAVSIAKGSPKANFNLGFTYTQIPNSTAAAIESFGQASDNIALPAATLNQVNLLRVEYRNADALQALRTSEKRESNPYVANTLATFYLLKDQPDSAVMAMKNALRVAPENSALYSNLALIYLRYEKNAEARSFLEAGLNTAHPGATLYTNALFFNLTRRDSLRVDSASVFAQSRKENPLLWLNYAEYCYRAGGLGMARNITDSLLADAELPEALLLNGMCMFKAGDVDGCLSRMAFLDGNYPEIKRYTQHFLGVGFFQRRVPEMAAEYFRISAENGRREDWLLQACMEADAGNADSAFAILKKAKTVPECLLPAMKEEALLLAATGQGLLGLIGVDPSHIYFADSVRLSLYAGRMGNRITALETFRQMLANDSSTVVPYLEMGRIDVALHDSTALSSIDPGIQKQPANPDLNAVRLRALLMLGRLPEAQQQADKLRKLPGLRFDHRLALVENSLAQGDTATGLPELVKLTQEDPLAVPALILLSRTYQAQGKTIEAHNTIFDALNRNPRNPGMWEQLARLERVLDRPMDCGAAAWKALESAHDPAFRSRIQAEYSQEIRIFTEENPIF